MKANFLILIVTVGFTNFIYSQQNYISYHQSCRSAEKNFMIGKTETTFHIYDSLFKTYDFVFPRDCYMAAQFAHKTNNDSLAIEYLIRAIPYGLNLELMLKNDTANPIKSLFTSPFWKNYESQFKLKRQEYLSQADFKLKNQLLTMVDEDQKWRKKNNKWFNRNFRPDLEKKFEVVNKRHVHSLDSIFKLKGYPGIWLTGVGDSISTPHNNACNLSDIPYIILYHYDSAYVRFGDFLLEEVKKGHLDVRTFAMIRDFNDRFLVKKEKEQKMYYNIWWEMSNFTKEEFERHCDEIGCATKEHRRKLSKALGKGYENYWWPFR